MRAKFSLIFALGSIGVAIAGIVAGRDSTELAFLFLIVAVGFRIVEIEGGGWP